MLAKNMELSLATGTVPSLPSVLPIAADSDSRDETRLRLEEMLAREAQRSKVGSE